MTGSTESARTLPFLMARLGRLNEAFIEGIARDHHTTPTELTVLAALSQIGAPLTPTQLSGALVQTSGGVTATLKRLQDRGHVRRRSDPDDGRVSLVAITPKGARFCAAALDDLLDRYAELLSTVDVDAGVAAIEPLLATLERSLDLARSKDWNFRR